MNNLTPNQNIYPQNMSPNAVSINIVAPQAFANAPATNPLNNGNFYSMYGVNQNPALPLYPANYNNMIHSPAQMQPQQPQQNQANNSLNNANQTNLYEKTGDGKPLEENSSEKTENNKDSKDKEPKTITPLTDDYVKSLENYLNNDNPKIRLIAAKDVMERFKEDENRKDNQSLIPLLNKTLRDPNAAVRFLALTTLQLGYCVGNDETIQILKEIQATNQDKLSEDSILASEILLKLAAPQPIEKEKGVE